MSVSRLQPLAFDDPRTIDYLDAVFNGVRQRMGADDFQGVTFSDAERDLLNVPEDADDYAELEQLCAVVVRELLERQRERAA